ncbi:MAG: hypothetical protein GVY04_04905 [Cyanobacteria bacterium]|jgi:hypothetical protein|nr:hypothetical protein [Cyanobacteria bacterium GSL.Bin1]
MVSQWTRHNNHAPCPVCSETKKGCRTQNQTNIVHCRGESPSPEYRFLKEDKLGFGMYKLETEIEAFSEQKKAEWLEERKTERERQQRQWEEQLKQQLSESERDRALRNILSQLTLTEEHRSQLQARGLTKDQIKTAGYRSVSQWQKLNQKLTPALAGVNRYGIGLVTPDSGILVPIPNENGQWVGYQLRRDNPKDGNKYLWSASEQKRNHRPTIQNRDGELPLGIWGSPKNDGAVYLCESPGIKPYIASLELNHPVIGAAGANFTSSPKALSRALGELNAKTVIFLPDAGAVLNRHIHRQTISALNLLAKWHYSVQFAWWGQTSKSDADIDELESRTKIQYLTPPQFLKLADTEQQKHGKVPKRGKRPKPTRALAWEVTQ